MNQIELWKLGTDILLMLSLAYLSIRVVRSAGASSQSGRMIELESTLRALIKEADASGRSLSDTLSRRQQGLERLLTDLEGAEQRIGRASSSSDQVRHGLEEQASRLQLTKAALERTVGDAERIRSILAASIATAPAARTESPRIQPQQAMQQHAAPQYAAPIAEVEFIEDQVAAAEPEPETKVQPKRTQRIPLEQQVEVQAERPAPEPPSFVTAVQAPSVGKETTRARERYARAVGLPLSQQVERQVTPVIEDVFNAAEEIVRAGEDLSAETAERSSAVVPPSLEPDRQDPRLGVLGRSNPSAGIRRQVSVL